MKLKSIALFVVTATTLQAQAKVTLAEIFTDNMVLQRGKPMNLWGKADKGEKVVVKWNGKEYAATAGEDGSWSIALPKQKAGGPYKMQVGDTELKNVMVGDVWLCSGQSNMDVTVERVSPQYPNDVEIYKNDKIRLLRVQNTTNTHAPQTHIPTDGWHETNPQTAWRFSAMAYFLARRMYEKTGVAQGVIVNSWGGTPIEAWISADSLKEDFPQYYNKTLLYQNDEYVRHQQQANMLANRAWENLLATLDRGVGQEDWTRADYDDSQWKTVNQYSLSPDMKTFRFQYPDAANVTSGGDSYDQPSRCGSTWFRQHITIDAKHAGKKARLLLGTLYDAEFTYVNGKLVGNTTYQYPPRRYDVPEGLLREGDNVITVRFVNRNGAPRFVREKPYKLVFGDGEQPLGEEWKMRKGADMPRCNGADVSLHTLPYTLYNAVLYPLHQYPVAGMVWNQGEANTDRAQEYEPLLRKLMNNWRTLWGEPDMPFAVVQLANYMEPASKPQPFSGWARLRNAQRRAVEADKNACLAVAIDMGEAVDIHPLRKREVADRVAEGLASLAYKDKKAKLSPRIASVKAENGCITLTFDSQLKEGSVCEIDLSADGRQFVEAEAVAKGNTLTVKSPVANPKTLHYAWKDNPDRANLYGANGVPVSPFEQEIK